MSKFTSAMNAAKDRSASVMDSMAASASAPEPRPEPPPPVPTPEPPRRGRPAGKRSSLDTVQVTAYIQNETHYATKLALLMNSRKGGPRQDFSDLVETLLVKWLATQNV